jgi:twitching motility two-component system response regulator PilH
MRIVKVLIIDDDPMTCNLVETILRLESYQTASVNLIGNEGIIPLLETEKPDIVILDYHLGPEETLKYVKGIRANKAWRRLPILMTSAIDRASDSLAAGANDFILKPFNWRDMTQRVNKMRDDSIFQEA